MNAIKNFKLVVVLLAALIFGAVQAATSHAYPGDTGYTSNELGFYNAVYNVGIESDGGPRGIVAVGWGVCSDLWSGYTRETVAGDLFYHSAVGQGTGGITLDQARAEVSLAVIWLCPGADASSSLGTGSAL